MRPRLRASEPIADAVCVILAPRERTTVGVGVVEPNAECCMLLLREVAGVVLAEIERRTVAIRDSISDGVVSALMALVMFLNIVMIGVVVDRITLLLERAME